MKRIIFSVVLLVAALALSYAHFEAKETGKINIKIATVMPKGSYVQNGIEDFCTEVRKATNNEVRFKIYAGGVQGDEIDVIRKIRLKQLHGGFFSTYALCRIVPEVKVTEVPFVFRNHEEVSYVRSRMEDIMNQYFEDQGYVVLGWTNLGFVYIFSKAPIPSIEVFRKQKCWVWGDDPNMAAFYKALGISPIPLSITDVLTSLSTNLIDTAANVPFGALAFRWHTKFRYMADTPGGNAVGAIIVTKEIYDKISHESQKKIKEIGKIQFERITKASMEMEEKSIVALKDAGIKIVPFLNSETDRKSLMEATNKARKSLVGKLFSKELLARTLSLLDEYRKNHPESTYIKIE